MSKHTCIRWAFDLSTWRPSFKQLALAVAAVQPEEQTRLSKFVFIDDFLSSLVGRLLIRKYVSDCTGLDYHELQFARDEHGKPYWQQPTNNVLSQKQLSFNVSHHGDFVVLAGIMMEQQTAAVDFGVGVDVMKIEYNSSKSISEFFRLMHKKFSKSEWQYITRPQHNEQQQLKAFMRHWCLKEAYVKELGVGITIDLQKISFAVDMDNELLGQPVTTTTLSCNDVARHNFHFEEHMLEETYCVAIAFKNCKPIADKFTMLNIEDLLMPSKKADQPCIKNYCEMVLQKQRKTQMVTTRN